MARAETRIDQLLHVAESNAKAVDHLAKLISGRPSWAVTTFVGTLTTFAAVLLTLVVTGQHP